MIKTKQRKKIKMVINLLNFIKKIFAKEEVLKTQKKFYRKRKKKVI